jgi:hypothetical protein
MGRVKGSPHSNRLVVYSSARDQGTAALLDRTRVAVARKAGSRTGVASWTVASRRLGCARIPAVAPTNPRATRPRRADARRTRTEGGLTNHAS